MATIAKIDANIFVHKSSQIATNSNDGEAICAGMCRFVDSSPFPLLENVIYNELLRRGGYVFVGKCGTLEIDLRCGKVCGGVARLE